AYKTQFVQRVAALVEQGLDLRMLALHTQPVSDIALALPDPRERARAPVTAPVRGSIELIDVSFRYADNEPLLIDKLNLRVEAGESIAIIGPSGSGKTTLVKLMLGLLRPTSGHIEIDGVPLARLGLARYRNAVSSVMQDDLLFAGSIAD